jgi:hypothetical protein
VTTTNTFSMCMWLRRQRTQHAADNELWWQGGGLARRWPGKAVAWQGGGLARLLCMHRSHTSSLALTNPGAAERFGSH